MEKTDIMTIRIVFYKKAKQDIFKQVKTINWTVNKNILIYDLWFIKRKHIKFNIMTGIIDNNKEKEIMSTSNNNNNSNSNDSTKTVENQTNGIIAPGKVEKRRREE